MMRRAVRIIAAVVFFVGAAVFLGPYVNRWMAAQDSSDVIEIFQAETAAGREEEDSGGGDNEDGGDTFFSWVTAEGGKGAYSGCYTKTTDIDKAEVASNGQRYNSMGISGVSNGGGAGDVKIWDTSGPFNGPKRDYRYSRIEDEEPKSITLLLVGPNIARIL